MGFINRLDFIKIYCYMLWVLLIISIVEGIFVVLLVCKYFSSGIRAFILVHHLVYKSNALN